jgi:Glycosyl hydrolase catalytic core
MPQQGRSRPRSAAVGALLLAVTLGTAACASGSVPVAAQGTAPASGTSPASTSPASGTSPTTGTAPADATGPRPSIRTTPSGGAPSTTPGGTGQASAGVARPAAEPATKSAKKGAAVWSFTGLAKAFADSGASWYYNWSPSPPGTAAPAGEFVPMIWGAASVTPQSLTRAKAAGGTLLGFNEPDLGSQANLTVEQALALWPQLQATGMRLVSPAVAAGGATPGGWLDRFMTGAAAKGYRVDAIALHWYGGDFSAPAATAQLRQYVTAVHDRYHKPVWLTEFALMRFGPTVTPTAAQQAAFVTSSTAVLQGLPFVERYAWFSFPTPTQGGLGTGLYSPGGTPTTMGAAYRLAG